MSRKRMELHGLMAWQRLTTEQLMHQGSGVPPSPDGICLEDDAASAAAAADIGAWPPGSPMQRVCSPSRMRPHGNMVPHGSVAVPHGGASSPPRPGGGHGSAGAHACNVLRPGHAPPGHLRGGTPSGSQRAGSPHMRVTPLASRSVRAASMPPPGMYMGAGAPMSPPRGPVGWQSGPDDGDPHLNHGRTSPLHPTPIGRSGTCCSPSKNPLHMARHEAVAAKPKIVGQWDRDAATNGVSRTFRLGAPLTPSERPARVSSSCVGSPSAASRSLGSDACLQCGEQHAVAAGCSPRHRLENAHNADGISSRPSTAEGALLAGGTVSSQRPPSAPLLGMPDSGDNGDEATVTGALQATERRMNYIRMQREYVEERIRKLRSSEGYRALPTEVRVKLPDLQTALAAVRHRDDELKKARAAQQAAGAAAAATAADGCSNDGDDGGGGLSADAALNNGSGGGGAAAEASVRWSLMVPGESGASGGNSPRVPSTRLSGRLSLKGGLDDALMLTARRSHGGASSGSARSPRCHVRRQSSRRSMALSVAEIAATLPPVDQSKLYLLDAAIQPDREDDAVLAAKLAGLKDDGMAHDGGGEGEERGTYSHLVKPALNSAANPFTMPGSEEWDTAVTLCWANRGIGAKKMPVLRDTLLQNSFLTGLQIGGNNLNNTCIADILAMLSLEAAPPITQLDLSRNNNVDWRCSYALAQALGLPPGAAAAAGGGAPSGGAGPAPSVPEISSLRLTRLLLSGIKLGDKGTCMIAKALESGSCSLKELDVSRCGISDHGGVALFQALRAGGLAVLDVSWNSLRGDSAAAMQAAMQTNGTLQSINISHNGFSDPDAARVLMSLTQHGTWRNVDLSYNNLGSGSAIVLGELVEMLGRRTAELIGCGLYTKAWDLEARPAGKIDRSEWLASPQLSYTGGRGSGSSAGGGLQLSRSRSARVPRHLEIGDQLEQGPVLLNVSGNPLGFAGLRQVLHALDSMSVLIEDASLEAHTQGGGRDSGKGLLLPPWPLHVLVASCNIDIADTPPTGSALEGLDSNSPNPFLPSLFMATDGALAAAGAGAGGGTVDKKKKGKDEKKGGKGKGKGKGGGADDGGDKQEYKLSIQSQSMNLCSPAGKYALDLSHPASALAVRHLLSLQSQLEQATERGNLPKSVALMIKELMLDDKPIKVEKLAGLSEAASGKLSFRVVCPNILLATEPAPLTEQTLDWMMVTLMDKSCAELWKLSVMQVACSHFYFTWEQALDLVDLFDPELSMSERLRAAEMMYARCTNPLFFWENALPVMPPLQVKMLIERVADLAAFDFLNPAGRYMLNLSRPLDRFMACRLQEASALENPWAECKYYLNWRNATLGGAHLSAEKLMRLRDYTIPVTGTLRIDYVTYMVPDPETSQVCSEEEVLDLFSKLRYVYQKYAATILDLRRQHALPGESGLEDAAERQRRKEAERARLQRRSQNAVPSMAKTLGALITENSMAALRNPAGTDDDDGFIVDLDEPAHAHGYNGGGAGGPIGGDSGRGQPWWAPAGFSAAKALLKRWQVMSTARHEKAAAAAARRGSGTDASGSGNSRPSSPLRMQSTKADAPRGATPSKASRGSGSKAKDDAKGSGSTGPKEASVYPPPSLRTAGAHMTSKEIEVTEQLAMQLLMVRSLEGCSVVLSRCSARHVARILYFYMTVDPAKGPKACALLMEAMSPLVACKLLYNMYDVPLPLLPPEHRHLLLAAMRPEVLKTLAMTQQRVNEAALQRARELRILAQSFAAHAVVSSKQLIAVLKFLRFEQDRVAFTVTLWSRVVDRNPGIYEAYQVLTEAEQRQVQHRLGHWHVWMTLGRPHGLHFYLDIREQEQKDIAKEIVKLAVKATAAAKKANPTKAANHLLNLRGNGSSMSIPEDDKTWMMMESSYQSIEFDFMPSPEQVEARRNAAASKIAEVWRGISLSRAVVRAHREAEAARGVSSDPVGVPVGGVLPAPPQPPLLRPPSSRGSSPLPGSKPRRPSLPASGRRTPV